MWKRVSEQLAVRAEIGTEPTKRRRARRSSIVAAVSVSLILGLLVAGVAVLTRTTSRRHPSVVAGAGSASTQAALTSEPTHTLLASIDTQQGMEIADVDAGTAKSVVAGPVNLGPCNTCPVVGRGDSLFFSRDGRAYMADRAGGSAHDLGPANLVFGASDNRSVWVASTSRDSAAVTKLDEHGDRIGGPWTVPAGYHISQQFLPKEIGGRILVLLGPVDSRSLYAWDPAGGGFSRIGDALFVVDTYRHPDASAEALAWVPEASCRSGLRRCSLALTDIASNLTRTVDAPRDSNGFIGGGAYSPDGRTLAAFVEAAPTKQGPAARLVLIDTASGAVQEVRGSQIGVGESYGFATWDPTGKWLFFGGFPGNMLVHRVGTDDAVALGLPARYTSVALTAPAASAPATPGSQTGQAASSSPPSDFVFFDERRGVGLRSDGLARLPVRAACHDQRRGHVDLWEPNVCDARRGSHVHRGAAARDCCRHEGIWFVGVGRRTALQTDRRLRVVGVQSGPPRRTLDTPARSARIRLSLCRTPPRHTHRRGARPHARHDRRHNARRWHHMEHHYLADSLRRHTQARRRERQAPVRVVRRRLADDGTTKTALPLRRPRNDLDPPRRH